MKKYNVALLLHNPKNNIRNYLVMIISWKEFVVCSNFKEIEENKVEWDWGHYFDTFEEALKFYNENNKRKKVKKYAKK